MKKCIKMSEENISQEFRLNKTDKIKNYLIEETNQNELTSKKHKKVFSVLNYIDHLLMVTFKITGRISISAFASLHGVPIQITRSTIGLKNLRKNYRN